MLVRTLNIPVDEELTGAGFTDEIPQWLQPYLAAAVRSGLTAGLPDQQTFGAEEMITGAEVSVMLKNALALTADAPEEAAETSAEESEISAWAQDALTAAVRNGFNLQADAPPDPGDCRGNPLPRVADGK